MRGKSSSKFQNLVAEKKKWQIWHMFMPIAKEFILRAARKSDEMLEPYEWKRSCTVLRRERASNRSDLADYAALAKMLDGEVINIVPGGDGHMNPLEIVVDYELEDETNPINAKANFVLEIIECILNSPFGINSIQQTIIDECVHARFDPFVKNG